MLCCGCSRSQCKLQTAEGVERGGIRGSWAAKAHTAHGPARWSRKGIWTSHENSIYPRRPIPGLEGEYGCWTVTKSESSSLPWARKHTWYATGNFRSWALKPPCRQNIFALKTTLNDKTEQPPCPHGFVVMGNGLPSGLPGVSFFPPPHMLPGKVVEFLKQDGDIGRVSFAFTCRSL